MRSLWKLQSVEPGFATTEVLTLRVAAAAERALRRPTSNTRSVAVIRNILERLGSSPEVRGRLATALPATRDTGSPAFTVEGWTPNQDDLTTATSMSVTGYFPALGARLIKGRLLEDRDDEHAAPAAVINETFARTYFRTEEAIGRRFRFVNASIAPPSAPWITIVGVVADVKEDGSIRPSARRSTGHCSRPRPVARDRRARSRRAATGNGGRAGRRQAADPNLLSTPFGPEKT